MINFTREKKTEKHHWWNISTENLNKYKVNSLPEVRDIIKENTSQLANAIFLTNGICVHFFFGKIMLLSLVRVKTVCTVNLFSLVNYYYQQICGNEQARH